MINWVLPLSKKPVNTYTGIGSLLGMFSASSGYAEQRRDALLVQIGADHAQTAGVIRRAAKDLGRAGHIVQSAATRRRPLRAQMPLGAQARCRARDRQNAVSAWSCSSSVYLCGVFLAPGGEHLIRVMIVVMAAAAVVVIVMMVLVVVIVAAAAMIVVMLMFMIELMLVVMIVFVVVLMLVSWS